MKATQSVNSGSGEESNWASDASLFQPDTMLSTEYFENLHRKTAYEPEKRLMLAILEDAIHCYVDNLDALASKRRRLFEDAAEWIVARNHDSVFSFESVCDSLGMNPEYVRQGVLRWRKKVESAARPAVNGSLGRSADHGSKRSSHMEEISPSERKSLLAAVS